MKTELLYSRPSAATQSMILGRRSDSICVFPDPFAEVGSVLFVEIVCF